MMNPPKVFFVDPMSYHNLALYDYSLLSNFDNLDFVYFGNHKYDIEDGEIPIQRLYDYDTKFSFLKIYSYIKSQRKLMRHIRKEKPNVIHFQWFKFAIYDYLMLKRIRNMGVKIVYTAHNVVQHYGIDRYTAMYDKIYKTVDIIIVHSERTKDELIQKYHLSEEKIKVVPHGILSFDHIDSLKVEEYVKKIRRSYDIGDQVVFAMLGEVNFYKGVDIVIDAWKSPSLTDNDTVKLIFAGKGKYSRLEELDTVKNTIVINRFLETEEFMAILKIADFILLPYRQISQSGVLLTTLHEKKRVIVSNVGGLVDPFRFGEIGYILERLESKFLTDAILKAANESDKFPKNEVWEAIFHHYDWRTIALSTQKVYEELAIN